MTTCFHSGSIQLDTERQNAQCKRLPPPREISASGSSNRSMNRSEPYLRLAPSLCLPIHHCSPCLPSLLNATSFGTVTP